MRFDFAGGRTPYEIGLGWTVKLDKGEFIGREALIRRKEAGFKDKLVTITIQDGYVPPSGQAILKEGEQVGQTTSAAFGYTVGQAVTLGYVPVALATTGTRVEILDKDGTSHPASVARRAPYDPDGTRLRA
jgi:aminomethyltransferase